MKYFVNMIWPDGTESVKDDVFDTYEEAEQAGLYDCSCFAQGNEILEMGGHDHMIGDADFEIIESEE